MTGNANKSPAKESSSRLSQGELPARQFYRNVIARRFRSDALELCEERGQEITELVGPEGVTLGEWARQTSRSFSEIGEIIARIADGLDFLHAQNVIHRDIKPQNILITRNSEPLIVDFGLAQIVGRETATEITGQNVVVGTPAYMSPEAVRARPVDPRSDIYSLGVVLYELLTGRFPFEASSLIELLTIIPTGKRIDPRTIRPNIPQKLADACLAAIAVNPDHRFTSASEFAAAIRAEESQDSNRRLRRRLSLIAFTGVSFTAIVYPLTAFAYWSAHGRLFLSPQLLVAFVAGLIGLRLAIRLAREV